MLSYAGQQNLMAERLPASQRIPVAKSVKGLKQQVESLHADVLRRVKVDFQLFRLNKTLRYVYVYVDYNIAFPGSV